MVHYETLREGKRQTIQRTDHLKTLHKVGAEQFSFVLIMETFGDVFHKAIINVLP